MAERTILHMKTRVIIGSLWVLSLAVAFLIAPDARTGVDRGQTANNSASFLETAPLPSHSEKKIQIVEKIVMMEREAEEGGFGEVNSYSLDAGEIQRRLSSGLADGGDVMQKNLIVAEMLAKLSPENIPAALAAFENAPRGPLNDQNFRLFMYAWGEIDGQAAVDYALTKEQERKGPYGSSTSAMIAWGSKDPLAAREYVETMEETDKSRRTMVYGLVRGWAKVDVFGAQDYVATMEDVGGRKKLIDHLSQEHIRQRGTYAALAWADQVAANSDGSSYAGEVVTQIAVNSARKDAVGVQYWLERNIDSPFLTPKIFEEVADELTEINPAAGAAFLDRYINDERVTGTVIAEMTEEWARKDPVATAAWVNQYLGYEKVNHQVIHSIAGEWADKDPDAAIGWVAGLENRNLQKQGLAAVVNQWAKRDPSAVGGWLNSQTRKDDLFDPAIQSYVNRLYRETPLAALSWAQQITKKDMRERNTIRAGQAMMRQDREAMLAWLPTSGLSQRAQNSILKPHRK